MPDIQALPMDFSPVGSGLPRSQTPDTGLVHITAAIRAIEATLGTTYGKGGKEWDRDLTMETGFLWENVLETAMAERWPYGPIIRPGEVTDAPLVGSPDGLGPDPEDPSSLTVYEYKCTWTSTRKPMEDRWSWLTQAAAYCHMLGVRVAIFHVLHLNGNYRDARGPTYLAHRVVFADHEIAETWEMLRNQALKLLEDSNHGH